MLTGENGILNQATNAKLKTDEAHLKEKIELAISAARMGEDGLQELNQLNLQKEIDKQIGNNKTIVIDNGDNTYTIRFIDSKLEFHIDSFNINIIDYNKKMIDAKAPEEQKNTDKNIIGIDLYGNPVNMDLWYYTFDYSTNGYALNLQSTLDGNEKTAGYRGKIDNDGNIEGNIPKYIKGEDALWYPVTNLYRTFQGNDSTNIELAKLKIAPKIPNTVVNMLMTFEYCSGLSIVTNIPGSVQKLRWTFDGYTALEEMPQIGYGVVDMTGAFSGCRELIKITKIPNSVINLDRTFEGCSKLINANIEIPSSVKNMESTFMNCSNLILGPKNIPLNVEKMNKIFQSCGNLTGVMVINAKPIESNDCFRNTSIYTEKPLILIGDSEIIKKLISNSYNTAVISEL